MHDSILYFAYGSNLHPIRLRKRVHDVEFVGIAELHSHALRFHKRSIDESAKCDAFLTGVESDCVIGALYRIPPKHLPDLDSAEGRGSGYERESRLVFCQGTEAHSFTYIAEPSHIDETLTPYDWYKSFVICGAEYHSFPVPYIESIRCVSCIPDPNAKRAQLNAALLNEMEYA